MQVCDLFFDLIPFWLQVYEIPIIFMNREVAEGICFGIEKACRKEKLEMEA